MEINCAGRALARFDQMCSRLAHVFLRLANFGSRFGPTCQSLARIGPTLTNFGRDLPKLDRNRPNVGQTRCLWASVGQILADFGQVLADFVQHLSTSASRRRSPPPTRPRPWRAHSGGPAPEISGGHPGAAEQLRVVRTFAPRSALAGAKDRLGSPKHHPPLEHRCESPSHSMP